MHADTSNPELALDDSRREHRDAPGLGRRLRRTGRKISSRTVKIVLAIVVLLVGARIALPYVVLHVLNDRLANLEGYHGRLEDVDISLYRGAYRLEGLRIVKTGGEQPEPFFTTPEIDISVEWDALFDGKIVAEIVVVRPVLNFIVEGGGAEEQTGQENDWRATVDDMVPLTINRFVIRGGEVHYRDYGQQPEVDLRVDRIGLVARGLSNERQEGERLPADIHLDARVQRSGTLVVDARLDPWEEEPTFNLSLRMRDLPAVELNPALRAYAGVDAEGGTTFLYSEIQARQGRFRGYVKPMAEGLSIFRFGEDGDFFDVLGDAIVGLVTEIFSNWREDRLAVRVPVSGTFDAPETDPWAVVGSVLYNAFIDAIKHGLDDREGWGPEDGEGSSDEGGDEEEQRSPEEIRQRREAAREHAEQRRERMRERREALAQD